MHPIQSIKQAISGSTPQDAGARKHHAAYPRAARMLCSRVFCSIACNIFALGVPPPNPAPAMSWGVNKRWLASRITQYSSGILAIAELAAQIATRSSNRTGIAGRTTPVTAIAITTIVSATAGNYPALLGRPRHGFKPSPPRSQGNRGPISGSVRGTSLGRGRCRGRCPDKAFPTSWRPIVATGQIVRPIGSSTSTDWPSRAQPWSNHPPSENPGSGPTGGS